jgi:hypothetical protein
MFQRYHYQTYKHYAVSLFQQDTINTSTQILFLKCAYSFRFYKVILNVSFMT